MNTAGLTAVSGTFTDDNSAAVTLPFAFTYQGEDLPLSMDHRCHCQWIIVGGWVSSSKASDSISCTRLSPSIQ
jgi:hypothetical protein